MGVVEVGWHRNDCILHGVTQVGLCRCMYINENHIIYTYMYMYCYFHNLSNSIQARS